MKLAIRILAVLAFASALFAADLNPGTWKLNVSKSKSTPNRPLPKAETAVVVAQGDHYEVIVSGTEADGRALSVKYDQPMKGGRLSYSEGGPPAGASTNAKRVDDYTIDFTTTRDGKDLQTIHSVIRRDGKTLRRTARGIDPQGKSYKRSEVWDKE